MTTRMRFATITICVALATALAGCGGSASSGAERSSTTNADPSSTTTTTVDPPAPTTTTSPVDTTAVIVEPGCSATGEDMPGDAAVPAAVAATRDAILAAALTCDFAGLAALAGDEFTYSFGGSDDPAGYWMAAEESGDDVLATLVRILAMSHGSLDTALASGEPTELYYWPSAFGDNPTDEQWKEVAALYSDEEIQAMKDFGGYVGYRAGITADGTWLFFVAGD